MESNTLLGIKIFDHPVFQQFRKRFYSLVRAEASIRSSDAFVAKDPLINALSVDSLIQHMARQKPNDLKKLLDTAVRATFNAAIPYNRVGDAVFSFRAFVLTHHRPPTASLNIHDILYHLKLSDEFTGHLRVFVTDKEYARIFITGIVGADYVIPSYAVLRSDSDVDRFQFPTVCAIKPTHQSGKKLLLREGGVLDRDEIKSWLRQNYYFNLRERNYLSLEPKIIIEELLVGFYELSVFCVQGAPKALKIIRPDARSRSGKTVDFFSKRFERLEMRGKAHPNSEDIIARPPLLDEIFRVSLALAQHFNFIRIDFYTNDTVLKVGEITNCDTAGLNNYAPEGADKLLSHHLFS
jgi:hypothetical protein